MCPVSGWNTGWPPLSRRTNATAPSASGSASATSGNSRVTVAVPLRFWSSETAATVSPRNWLPVSPMNTRAGGKL